jgi:hypothetical protein
VRRRRATRQAASRKGAEAEEDQWRASSSPPDRPEL